jgi:hypothetical protein
VSPKKTEVPAETELRALVSKFAPAHARLVGTMRRRLRTLLPAAQELVYEYRDCFVLSYSPSGRGYEGILAIRAGADVRLYFNRGKGLADPAKLLKGSGSLVRWIPVPSASTLARPEVVRLMDQAVADHAAPAVRGGRGSAVIRSTSNRRRRVSG